MTVFAGTPEGINLEVLTLDAGMQQGPAHGLRFLPAMFADTTFGVFNAVMNCTVPTEP